MATHGSSTSRRLPREFLDFAELVRIRAARAGFAVHPAASTIPKMKARPRRMRARA